MLKTIKASIPVNAATSGNPMSFLDTIYRYAYSRLGDREEAEDVAIEVVQAVPSPAAKEDLKLYMLGMARRKVVNRMRRNRSASPLFESDSVQSNGRQVEDSVLVGQVLDHLNPDQREALICKYVVGLSIQEISALMERSPEAVESLLQRSKTAFATRWTRATGEEIEHGS